MSDKAVFCIIDSEAKAEKIADELRLAGFSGDDLSVLFPDKQGTRDFAHEKNTKAPEGAATGAATGGVLGGALGWIVGPFIAAGPIMAALGGAAIGAASGGIAGSLIGFGIPELEAKQYETRVKGGNILFSVHTENAAERKKAEEIFERCGAEDISATAEEGVSDKAKAARA